MSGREGNNNNNNNNDNGAAREQAFLQWVDTQAAPGDYRLPRNADPADDKTEVARLGHLAKLNLHGFGLVVREIPKAVLDCVDVGLEWTPAQWKAVMHMIERAARTNAPLPATLAAYLRHEDYKIRAKPATLVKRFKFAQMLRDEVVRAMKSTDPADRVCTEPLTAEYVRQYFTGGGKPDTVGFMAFKLAFPPAGGNRGAARYKLVALGSYSTMTRNVGGYESNMEPFFANQQLNNVDEDDDRERQYTVTLTTPQRQGWLQAGRIAELDLLCSATKGAGPALLSHMLARVAARKKGGQRRYRGVLTYLAARDGANGGRTYPLERSIRAAGFTRASVRLNAGDLRRSRTRTLPYYGVYDNTAANTSWVQLVSGKLRALDSTGTLRACPVVPRSGRSYCV